MEAAAADNLGLFWIRVMKTYSESEVLYALAQPLKEVITSFIL